MSLTKEFLQQQVNYISEDLLTKNEIQANKLIKEIEEKVKDQAKKKQINSNLFKIETSTEILLNEDILKRTQVYFQKENINVIVEDQYFAEETYGPRDVPSFTKKRFAYISF